MESISWLDAATQENVSRGKVMLVDDTPENLSLLREILNGSGFEALAFPSGALALQAAEKIMPDLILLDINMPEMNGYEVCAALKAIPALAQIPVIFLSGLTEPSDKIHAFKAGGVDYITKPFHPLEVLARVDAHLSLANLRKDHVAKNAELAAKNVSMEELEQLRDSLVHMIVHDMRSLLMVVVGFQELMPDLVDAPDFKEKWLEYNKKALCASELLVEMSSAMLDVSKMEAQRLTPELGEFDLAAVADDLLDRLDPLRGNRELSRNYPPGQLMVTADRALIGRVVLNLLSNAFKFSSDKNGFVEVGISSREGRTRFWVSDNGAGIPPESVERVFDKYWQGVFRARGIKHSTGLGLTFCKMAVEAHGGRIGVESKFGQGATFWFEL